MATRGRPRKYLAPLKANAVGQLRYADNKHIAEKVCEFIIQGMTVQQIAQLPGMPGEMNIWNWVRHHDDFRAEYTQAREISAYQFEDEALALARTAKTQDEARVAQLRLNTVIWLNKVRNRRLYGDKTDVTGEVKLTLAALVEASQTPVLEPPTIEQALDEAEDG